MQKVTKKSQFTHAAQNWARKMLTYNYPDEYRSYYLDFKGLTTGPKANSAAQSKAQTLLVKRHFREYQQLYLKGYGLAEKAYLKYWKDILEVNLDDVSKDLVE